jgi:hypothetical protein
VPGFENTIAAFQGVLRGDSIGTAIVQAAHF